MTKNPLINAISASAYIVLVAMFMYYGSKFAGPEDSILAPIAIISLFTLSAAVMCFIFCYQPVQLYFDNKKKAAIKLFVQTVGYFGLITLTFLVLLFSGILK